MEQIRAERAILSIDSSKWLAVGALTVAMGLVLRDAWVTEDAFITLRTVDNWVNGYGLRWNTDERVQGYTHPLWMFLLSAIYLLLGNAYATAILAGLGSTLAALVVLARNARSVGHALAAILLVTLSRSFIDFSTSGLENPLTHLLVAVFFGLYVVRPAGLRMLVFTATLLALNRSDATIVVLPALLHELVLSLRARGFKRTCSDGLIAASPLFAWELFSLFYYGSLVPNTAYAKLNTGLDAHELAAQGLTYLLNTVAWDLPAIIATLMGVALGLSERRLRPALLVLGIVVYYAYVVRVGGDFMLGRFLTLPLFLAACLVSNSKLPLELPERTFVLLAPLFVLFFHAAATEKYPVGDYQLSGVADERSYFRDNAALMMSTRHRQLPDHQWGQTGVQVRARKETPFVAGNIGFMGFSAGPEIHIVDRAALTEPFLARLPMRYRSSWRVGHYDRELPAGYLDTLRAGNCQMTDANLCRFHDKLKLVVSSQLWSWRRIKAIVALNLGEYDKLIDFERYRHPEVETIELDKVSQRVADGTTWNDPLAHVFHEDGVIIQLGKLSHANSLELALDANDDYAVTFRNNTRSLDRITLEPHPEPMLRTRIASIPEEVAARGFDNILVRPIRGDGLYSLAYLRLFP